MSPILVAVAVFALLALAALVLAAAPTRYCQSCGWERGAGYARGCNTRGRYWTGP